MPDGKALLVVANTTGAGVRLYLCGLEGAQPRPITPEGIAIGFFPISPDGKFVLAQASDSAFWLFPTAGGDPQPVPGLEPDDRPVRFTANGQALFGFPRGELPGRIFRLDMGSGAQETWKELHPRDPAGVVEIVSVQMTPDGSSYAYSYHRILSDLFLIQGLH